MPKTKSDQTKIAKSPSSGSAKTQQGLLTGNRRRAASKPPSSLLDIRRSQGVTLAGEEAHLWLQIDICAPETSGAKRPPADVAIVLDCSGSMGHGAGSALETAGEAARFVFERLGGADRSALVLYGSSVQIAQSLGSDHQQASARAVRLPSLGMTALADGLYSAIEQLGGARSKKRSRQVFLLSDGNANVGETDPLRIGAEVEKAAGAGIKVSTFGLSDQYDEDLLEALARAGNGGYHYLADLDDAPVAFAAELADLFSISLRDAELTLVPARGVKIERMLGIADDPGKRVVTVGDVPSGARRTLLVELRLKKALLDGESLIKVGLRHQKGGAQATAEEKLMVSSSSDENVVSGSVSEEVLARVAELEAALAQREAAKLADGGNFGAAHSLLAGARQQMEGLLANHAGVAQFAGFTGKLDELDAHTSVMAGGATDYSRAAAKEIKTSAYLTSSSRAPLQKPAKKRKG